MAHLCINCNAPSVHRAGDRFTCKKCGYRWDVAHEQANAAYLASQGRQPAESSAPAMKGAGQIPPNGEQGQPTTEDQLVAALVKYTVAEIDELAGAAGVDLGDARLKHEKAAALIRSGKIALDEAGAVIVVDDEASTGDEGERTTGEGESE